MILDYTEKWRAGLSTPGEAGCTVCLEYSHWSTESVGCLSTYQKPLGKNGPVRYLRYLSICEILKREFQDVAVFPGREKKYIFVILSYFIIHYIIHSCINFYAYFCDTTTREHIKFFWSEVVNK